MTRTPAARRPHGQIRQSQIVTTFGPGAMVDLPKHSVLVGGLDPGTALDPTIHEPRLAAKLAQLLGVPALQLHAPPARPTRPRARPDRHHASGSSRSGSSCRTSTSTSARRRGAHAPARAPPAPHEGQVRRPRRKKRPVVPIRFVRACRRGHIGDIDWHAFVHAARECRRHALDGRARDERRPRRGLDPLRVRRRAARWSTRATAGTHGRSARATAPGRGSGVLRPRDVRRAQPAARPHGEQRLLPPDHERHLAAGRRRGARRRRWTRSGSTTCSTSRRSRNLAVTRQKKPPVRKAARAEFDATSEVVRGDRSAPARRDDAAAAAGR